MYFNLKHSRNISLLIALLFVFTIVPFTLSGCSKTSTVAPAKPSAAAIQAALTQRVNKFFASQGKAPYGIYQFTNIQLYKALKKNPNKYFLMDIRTPSTFEGIPGYQQGHIGGAVNIPYLDIPKAIKENKIPKDKIVVTICPTGQLANQAAGILRLLGYNAYALRLSMSGWNQKLDVLPPKHTLPNYPLVMGTAPGTFKP